jgi:DNA-binding PucR family transcriptional regulator
LLPDGSSPQALRAFIDKTLGGVLEHDARRGRSLSDTLRAYFEQSAHLNNTAATLGIHLNTLYQRFERMDRILGADWRTPDRLLDLHLAARLYDLSNVMDVSPLPIERELTFE